MSHSYELLVIGTLVDCILKVYEFIHLFSTISSERNKLTFFLILY